FYTVKLLQERSNILALLQKRFKYILVDEFQDVNWAQYVLVKLLARSVRHPERSPAGRSEGSQGTINVLQRKTTETQGDPSTAFRPDGLHSAQDDVAGAQLTVVGDDDQSIYAFRGASVSNILRFKEDFPNAKEIVLTENYRSGQEILDGAYKLIQNNNPDRLETKLKINKQLKSEIKNLKSEIKNLCFDSIDSEVACVIQKISEICENKSVVLDDIAILVRANSHADPFINALEKAGIPYEFLASSGLYRQPIVLDCFNFLKIITSYHDSTAVFRLLRLPFLDFKENDLQKLTGSAKKKSISYYEALKRTVEFGISKEGISIAEKLVSLIHRGMKQAREEKPTAILYNFLADGGYLNYLTREEETGNRKAIRGIHHLKQFLDFISRYETAVPDASVSNFIEHFNNILSSGDEGKLYQPTDTPDSVNIMTVHGAKGLEFKYVFVVNLIEERFPSRKRSDSIEIPLALVKEQLPEGDSHYQEERRLFYVAMTRAKECLYLTNAEDYGGVRKKKVSRFLRELGYKHDNTSTQQQNNTTTLKRDNTIRKSGLSVIGKQYELPKSFSFSQIRSYQTCPYQYKLANILKIPVKGNAQFSFGQSMHSTLQKFYQRVKELNNTSQGSLFGAPEPVESQNSIKVPSLEELNAMYDDSWIPDWYANKKQRDDYYEEGKKILKIFYTAEDGKWTIPLALEGWFKIKVGDYLINGRIDRVDQLADGSLEIIDYKTGKAKEKLTADDKDQLLIYQIAAQSLPEYKNIGETGRLTFYYLNDSVKTSFIGEDKELEKIKEKIIKTINNIRTGELKATPSKFVCERCDFRDICEYRE
ncbi:MAG: ATP-dependent DNA helicase, partial [Patescibacteria group bacterium]